MSILKSYINELSDDSILKVESDPNQTRFYWATDRDYPLDQLMHPLLVVFGVIIIVIDVSSGLILSNFDRVLFVLATLTNLKLMFVPAIESITISAHTVIHDIGKPMASGKLRDLNLFLKRRLVIELGDLYFKDDIFTCQMKTKTRVIGRRLPSLEKEWLYNCLSDMNREVRALK